LRGNLKSTSLRCLLFEVAFVWELTKETIYLTLGRLQGGARPRPPQKLCAVHDRLPQTQAVLVTFEKKGW
jgi:hypothetical protein